jgi:hypothetical protein
MASEGRKRVRNVHANIHHKVIRAYTQTASGTPSVQPKAVIAIGEPKSAEDTIDITSEVCWPDPQINCALGRQVQGGADESTRAIQLKRPTNEPWHASLCAIDQGGIPPIARDVIRIAITGPPGQ